MQQRAARIATDMVSTFADGSTIFRGLVSNISAGGIKISGITAPFKPSPRQYATVIINQDQKFKLNILPIWFKQEEAQVEVGFEIVSPSRAWHAYITDRLRSTAISL